MTLLVRGGGMLRRVEDLLVIWKSTTSGGGWYQWEELRRTVLLCCGVWHRDGRGGGNNRNRGWWGIVVLWWFFCPLPPSTAILHLRFQAQLYESALVWDSCSVIYNPLKLYQWRSLLYLRPGSRPMVPVGPGGHTLSSCLPSIISSSNIHHHAKLQHSP